MKTLAGVYEAVRRGETFALKRPLAGFLDDERFRERFLREAELGRTLHHPNIIRIFARGQVGNTPYFVMELIRGETLRVRLDRDGRLDATLAVRVAAQVPEALDYAHHKGVIHRDLKPSNIMLERAGGVRVMDYGLARARQLEGLTTTGAFLGTPSYAAPEAVDAACQPQSDVYSLVKSSGEGADELDRDVGPRVRPHRRDDPPCHEDVPEDQAPEAVQGQDHDREPGSQRSDGAPGRKVDGGEGKGGQSDREADDPRPRRSGGIPEEARRRPDDRREQDQPESELLSDGGNVNDDQAPPDRKHRRRGVSGPPPREGRARSRGG